MLPSDTIFLTLFLTIFILQFLSSVFPKRGLAIPLSRSFVLSIIPYYSENEQRKLQNIRFSPKKYFQEAPAHKKTEVPAFRYFR